MLSRRSSEGGAGDRFYAAHIEGCQRGRQAAQGVSRLDAEAVENKGAHRETTRCARGCSREK